MSPRSEEMIGQARDRATVAAELLAGRHLEAAVSAEQMLDADQAREG